MPEHSDFWAAIDQRIDAAVNAAVQRERDVLAHVIAKLQADISKRIDQCIAKIEEEFRQSRAELEQTRTQLRMLNQDKPDAEGVIRKEYLTPH
jgi:hypothetical protein